MSWSTYGFVASTPAGDRALILRVGDPQGLLAPYRAAPEFELLQALKQGTHVPVPTPVLHADDPQVLGAPFLLTEFVAGDTPTPWNGATERDAAERDALGLAFTDALAAIHAFDWQRSGLARWGQQLSRENAARAVLARWAQEAGHPQAPLPPAMHHALRWLEARAPVAQRLCLVHGDYRLGNFLREGGRITAVLDWELVHLGDPHEDLAWASMKAFAPPGSARVAGLMDRDGFVRRYAERSGIEVEPATLAYYAVFSQFKSAAMLLGATRRITGGRGRDMRMAAMGFQLAPTLASMLRCMEVAT